MKRILYLSLLVVLLAAGCRSSYPKGNVEQTITQLCQKEYKVKVQVKTVGHTIGALVVAPHVLSRDLTLTDAALNKIENVMLTTTRVTLSSDFSYDFFVISVLDPSTRVEVSFVRYLKDIRRLVSDDISRTEYFQRMLIEASVIPPVPAGMQEVYDLREYHLEDFLARQLGDRLKLQFQSSLVVDRLFHLATVEGTFVPDPRPGEGVFKVALYFTRGTSAYDPTANPQLHKDFLALVTQTAGPVIRRYNFINYKGMEIVDGLTEKPLAFLERQKFDRETPLSDLMELIRSLKKK